MGLGDDNDLNCVAAMNYLRSKNWITEAEKLELLF